MKKAILLFVLLAISTFTFAQKRKKLSSDESSKMTADQRYVHESQRKSKNGKKDLSLKKKIRTEEKQDKKARKMKGNRRPKGY